MLNTAELVILQLILNERKNFIKISDRKFDYFMIYLESYERYEDMQHMSDYKNEIITDYPESL